MIELFRLLRNQRNKSVKVKCDNLTYWRATRPTDFINYLTEHMDEYDIEVFNIEQGNVFDMTYVKSFDIEFFTDNETYDLLMKNFQCTIGRYNKDGLDISLYEYKE